MSTTKPDLPKSSRLVQQARDKAKSWIKNAEGEWVRETLRCNLSMRNAIGWYFEDDLPTMSADEIMERFLIGYFEAGTADGHALRNDPVSALVRCHLGDTGLDDGGRIDRATRVRVKYPDAFHWMLRLVTEHSRACQETLRDAFGTHSITLRRGVENADVHYAIESWAFDGQVSNYGATTLCAQVPLSSVLSIRGQEHEIVVMRPAWAPSIESQTPTKSAGAKNSTWRSALADGLERFAEGIRGVS